MAIQNSNKLFVRQKNERRKKWLLKRSKPCIHKNEVEIMRTINQLSSEDIESAVRLIDHQKKIMIFSAGLSSNVAREMMSKLQLFGKDCTSHDDFDYMKYYASRANRDYLVIAISISGATPEIAQALHIAKSHGSKIIALTAANPSIISDQADICINAYKSKIKEINFGLDVGSRIPLQVVTRILLDSYAIYKDLAPIREDNN
ncbi:SIS domain-containing protein [Lactococcus fujiensis]|uniref:SIS domain-containing protein n=1 Tax=Lactococcus fujiensis TaxID=610251 RepID=UPI000A716768|nr:MurR/RpiR family transcriptional regulator [Lactococcus fujiensis]